ncbi:A24 family peptidase [Roseospira goensis]|uniref:Prepilin peptidase CpaA n=1 Tax=Roseospira goensis TaxID=391922 RepID=A0A7W6S1C6_9PROT|nr:prepilin peptidase [Roseospira goensis]MBB4287090.1 prepilin peptidase CpaA [Roseospira goensis]
MSILMTWAGAAVVLLTAAAALQDVASRHIANGFSVAVAALFVPVAALAVGLGAASLADVGWMAAGALAVFVAGTVLFAVGMLGGGDVKLLTAVGLWIRPGALPEILVIIVVAGGLLSLALLALRITPVKIFEKQTFVAACFTNDQESWHTVPYGLAIALGTLAAWLTGALGLPIGPAPG